VGLPHLTIALLPDCTCGRTSVVIDPYGGLRVCQFSGVRFGNLKQKSLIESWHSLV
jgi:MoaA/NifB/PqqE/SkfB family radical SAM enzyme